MSKCSNFPCSKLLCNVMHLVDWILAKTLKKEYIRSILFPVPYIHIIIWHKSIKTVFDQIKKIKKIETVTTGKGSAYSKINKFEGNKKKTIFIFKSPAPKSKRCHRVNGRLPFLSNFGISQISGKIQNPTFMEFQIPRLPPPLLSLPLFLSLPVSLSS